MACAGLGFLVATFFFILRRASHLTQKLFELVQLYTASLPAQTWLQRL